MVDWHDKTRARTEAAVAIPGVKLERELGRDGMARVYQGFDTGFDPPRPVAAKLMSGEITVDPEFRRRFEREASLVADFRHHNIVRIHGSGEVGGTKYIVMELLAGGTLAEKLRGGPMSVTEALSVAASLAGALAYAHSRGIVHRDFKPGNVLFTGEGQPVLCDFGVAKDLSSDETTLTRLGRLWALSAIWRRSKSTRK